jgi:hypothetical protein
MLSVEGISGLQAGEEVNLAGDIDQAMAAAGAIAEARKAGRWLAVACPVSGSGKSQQRWIPAAKLAAVIWAAGLGGSFSWTPFAASRALALVHLPCDGSRSAAPAAIWAIVPSPMAWGKPARRSPWRQLRPGHRPRFCKWPRLAPENRRGPATPAWSCQPGRSHEWSNRSLQWFELRNSRPMGEVIVLDPGLNVPGLVSALVSLLAMAIYAINQAGKENDDDDSSPGGGLMQPTA